MNGWRARLEGLVTTYGPVAVGVWLALFGLTWAGFALAIHFGLEVESAAGNASTALAAYVATQVTKPLRVVITVALTPLAARLIGRKVTAGGPDEPLAAAEEAREER